MRSATKEERESVDNYIKSISQKVITISVDKQTTNGDVIKALFPNVPVDNFFQNTISFYPLMPNGLTDEIHFDEGWWNASYQKGLEQAAESEVNNAGTD